MHAALSSDAVDDDRDNVDAGTRIGIENQKMKM
jgi:hypothetical protein